jgi:hypothetical protein
MSLQDTLLCINRGYVPLIFTFTHTLLLCILERIRRSSAQVLETGSFGVFGLGLSWRAITHHCTG